MYNTTKQSYITATTEHISANSDKMYSSLPHGDKNQVE